MRHITKWAASGANVTQDHKGGRTSAKAFANIRAARLFTYGMQIIVAQHAFNFLITC